MTVEAIEQRRGETDLTDKYTADIGKSGGVGTFEEGTITKLPNQYHIEAASSYGHRIQTFVDAVHIGFSERLDLDEGETFDVSGLQYRFGEKEVSLRTVE